METKQAPTSNLRRMRRAIARNEAARRAPEPPQQPPQPAPQPPATKPAKKKKRKQQQPSPAGLVRKFRLPHGSRMVLDYDAVGFMWTGVLTVPGNPPLEFKAEHTSVHQAIKALGHTCANAVPAACTFDAEHGTAPGQTVNHPDG
jgi:hypothetical protein